MATINAWGSAKPVQETFGGTNQSTYTTGDILYASASNTLSKLAIGSSTNVLQVSGGVPAWGSVPGGASAWVFLQKLSANNSATITFDSSVITSTYPVYAFIIDSLRPVSSDQFRAQLSDDNGSTYKTTLYASNAPRIFGSGTGTTSSTGEFIIFPDILGSDAISNAMGVLYFSNLSTNVDLFWPAMFGHYWGLSSTGVNTGGMQGGYLQDTGAYNNIKFYFSATNIDIGNISLYGIKQS